MKTKLLPVGTKVSVGDTYSNMDGVVDSYTVDDNYWIKVQVQAKDHQGNSTLEFHTVWVRKSAVKERKEV